MAATTSSGGDSEKYRLAYEVFLDRVLNYLGAYLVKLFGSGSATSPELHGVVFSGGIGERSTQLRADVGNYLRWLNCEVDEERNKEGPKDGVDGGVKEVTKDGSGVRIFVCLTVSIGLELWSPGEDVIILIADSLLKDEESQTANMALNALRKAKLID